MSKTRIELVNRAASKAMLVASGQSLETEDFNVIDGAVDPIIADLGARDVIYIDDADAIDDAPFEWLADILAQTIMPDFGKPRDQNAIEFAEYRLNQIAASSPTYQTQTAEYF